MIYLDDAKKAEEIRSRLTATESLAVDSEAAGFHRYSDQICLVQLSTPDESFILDPLAFDASDLLRGPLEDPKVRILMHGGDYDMRLLHRDMGIRPVNLFDTQIAASLLAEDGLGLGALVERHLGVSLSKKFQRADWAKRPLTEGMLAYAADDTRYLHDLVAILEKMLVEAGRLEWAQEEFVRMEEIRWADEPDVDPVARVKKARGFEPREVERLRAALDWRDEIARERDRAAFRVVGDAPLMEAAQTDPVSVGDLLKIKGFPQGLARAKGDDLLDLFQEADRIPEAELRPFPRPPRSGMGRLTPEEEARIDRLKAVRNRVADAVGLPRGTVMSNGVVESIARARPGSAEEMARVDGVRAWQLGLLAEPLLAKMSP